MKYFIQQSISHPYWWRNLKFWGYHNNNKNPIYKLYWWSHKEKHEWDTAVFCDKNGGLSLLYVLDYLVC